MRIKVVSIQPFIIMQKTKKFFILRPFPVSRPDQPNMTNPNPTNPDPTNPTANTNRPTLTEQH